MSYRGPKERGPLASEGRDYNDGGRDYDEGLRSSEEEEPVDELEKDKAKTSKVYTAADTLLATEESSMGTHALSPDWSFGINYTLPVFNLQDRDQLVILYAGAHVGVIYNHTSTSQHLLQGHGGPISCLCMSEDRRWLGTADNGREPLLIIWDSYTGIPVHTLFNGPTEGSVIALAFSKDAKYLATLGGGEQQCVHIWDWTNEQDTPLWVANLYSELGFQSYIIFNPGDSTELLSNSDSQVLFYKATEGNLEYIAPYLNDKSFNQSVGSLGQSLFHWRGQQALTATSAGNLVLWDEGEEAAGRNAIKLLPLQREAITVLTSTDRWIVTGDVLGHIKFYDENFRLMSWYSDFSLDAIASISFSKDAAPEPSQDYPESCILADQPFVSRSFVVSTVRATVVHVKTPGGGPQTLLREHCAPLHAVACHPRRPILAMGSHSGILKVCDYNTKLTLASRVYESERIQCLIFDPQGFYVAVGFASGAVHILDASSLHSDAEDCFHFSDNSITHITFSLDSMYLATADTGKAVTVFHLHSSPGSTTQQWQLVGRHISHYKPIRELLFGVHLDSTRPRLLSLAMDRRLVEYDLDSSMEQQLLVLSAERVEQSAVPQCMTWYPPLSTERFLLTASDQHKMKLLNSTTNMCRKTLLGPTYESPVQKMVVLPGSSYTYYLAFITKDKVGLQILPLDGNPYSSLAVVCHPGGVSQLVCSFDGRFVFTSGGADGTVLRWRINPHALQATAALGGSHLDPFYALLEGGRGGTLCREMEDLFYYCQLRHQGIDSMAPRQVSTSIPLTEVPFLMRALGFFPSEQELEDMQNEVKFSKYAETGKYVKEVDLAEFLRLYINHRPAFGISRKELAESFRVLGFWDGSGQMAIPRDQLLELLQARGEHMREDEVVECLTVLSGEHMREEVEGEGILPATGASEKHAANEEYSLDCVIPESISAETFTGHILGFPSCMKTRDKSCPSE
ncbi:cilia- and flagella-associated protein 251 [Gadus macrocephalus]|uniref:cilia- and flagella-associated protein 251 n=1 Tax=Gadus macrocephalus TaxID=80720 RepID=UPI0028CB9767|nr:cilia- and flagella-associated protein 251 [Gadus macrocephalus]